MGTASECAATYGIVLMPEGECPKCGCLAYFEGHSKVWNALRDYLGHVKDGYFDHRVPGAAQMDGFRVFHIAREIWLEAHGSESDRAADAEPSAREKLNALDRMILGQMV